MEQDVLSLLKRTNFKNLSKGEVVSFASKIGEMRPEVARAVLAQFPEFVGLMGTTLTEYRRILEDIIKSDDDNIKDYYGIANKEIDGLLDSRNQFYDFVKQIHADYSKLLDNPNLSPEMIIDILNRESQLVELVERKDTEIRDREMEIEDRVNKKDSEKREFNWKLAGQIGFALITITGITAGILGGKFNFKPFKKL